MTNPQCLKEYYLVRWFSRPLEIFMLFILFPIFIFVVSKNNITLASIGLCIFAFAYFYEERYKIILFNDRIVIKRFLTQDKILFISALTLVKKRYTSALPKFPFIVSHEFHLNNGEIIGVYAIKDYYDLVENIKKINPDVKVDTQYF